MRIVIIPVALGGKYNLLQGDEVLIGEGEGHVGDDLDPLSDDLFPAGAPDLFAVILAIAGHHFMDGEEGFPLAEKAGIGHQLPGAAGVKLLAAEVVMV